MQETDTGAGGPLPPVSLGTRPAAGARRPACPCLPRLAFSQDLQAPQRTSSLPAAPYGPQRPSSRRLLRRVPGGGCPNRRRLHFRPLGAPRASIRRIVELRVLDDPSLCGKSWWEGRDRLPVGLGLALGPQDRRRGWDAGGLGRGGRGDPQLAASVRYPLISSRRM